MSKFVCYMDESFSEKVFCLSGIIIDDQNTCQIIEEISELKIRLGLKKSDCFKYSPDGQLKSKLMNILSSERDWLTSYRKKVINVIAKLDILLIVSIHEDKRSWLKKKFSPVDFYLWAFKFLIQRLYFSKADDSAIMVVVDKPPESGNLKKTESKICEYYSHAYNDGFEFDDNRIPPLKECSFSECPFFTKAAYSSLLQVADFCAGVFRGQSQDLLNGKNEAPSRTFAKKLIPKLYKTAGEVYGRGLIVWPKDSQLNSMIRQDVINLLSDEDSILSMLF